MTAPTASAVPVRLALDDVRMHFGGVRAVDGVTLAHDIGGVLGLIGPNGAGKTTLFNILSGVQAPTSGGVHLDDTDITGMRPDRIARLGIARTFQNLQLFSTLTVLENVLTAAEAADGGGLLASLLPTPGRREAAHARHATAYGLLERVGIERYAATVAGELPYGLQRRVEVARALAIRPRLVMLDEPLAGLSRAESADLAQLMRDLTEDGTTVLLVEHDVATVMTVCDRVLVLDHGRLIADGTPGQVQADPAVRAAYLGEEVES